MNNFKQKLCNVNLIKYYNSSLNKKTLFTILLSEKYKNDLKTLNLLKDDN